MGRAKSERLVFSHDCREQLTKKITGLFFFMFSGLVDAPGTRLYNFQDIFSKYVTFKKIPILYHCLWLRDAHEKSDFMLKTFMSSKKIQV